jgi:hypothetical protein
MPLLDHVHTVKKDAHAPLDDLALGDSLANVGEDERLDLSSGRRRRAQKSVGIAAHSKSPTELLRVSPTLLGRAQSSRRSERRERAGVGEASCSPRDEPGWCEHGVEQFVCVAVRVRA